MLDALRHFLLVCEHGTFRAAARHAHLSQPALSASVKKLEAELGAPLLVRSRRGAVPTEAGRLVMPHARAALGAIDAARRALEGWRDLETGEVRVGAGATVCTYVLPPIVARFRAAHPRISFSLRELTSEEAALAVERHDVDIAIVSGEVGRAFLSDELVLVGPERPVDLRTAPFVAFRHGAGSRDLLDRHFPERPVAMELGSIAAVLANVRAGAGLSLVSRFALGGDLERRGLAVVPDRRTPIRRRLRLVHGERALLSPAARAFLAALEEAGRALRGSTRRDEPRTTRG